MRFLAYGLAMLIAGAVTLPAHTQERVLRIGINAADIGQLDPHRAQAGQDRPLAAWMFDGLVRFPPGSADPARIEPDLAERWETSADGLVWTFHLRRGVRFHGDWGELTAEDVQHSLQRAADPQRSSFAGEFRALERVDVVDPHTVRVVFRSQVPSVLGLLSNYQGGFIVSRRADLELGERFRTRPIGTGPFAFAEHVTQQHVVLRAHEGYFRGRPAIDRVLYRFIESDASRELAFTAGELDMFAGRRDQRWVARMRGTDAQLDIIQPAEFRTVHLNMRAGPLGDRRVREAIVRAINVPQIVQFVGADIALPGRSVVPPGYLGEVPDGWSYPFDLARSRALLAEAGHGNGLTLRAVVSSISTQQPIMEVIQAQLRRAGIDLQLDVVDHATYHAQIRRDLSAIVFYGAARFPVAASYLGEFYHSRAQIGSPTAALNFSHCAAADAEIDAAAAAASEPTRIAHWQAAQRKIHEEICALPLFGLMQVWVRSRRVDLGYELSGGMNLAPALTERTRLR